MDHPAEDLPDGPFAPQGRPDGLTKDGEHKMERAGKRVTIAGLSCLGSGGLMLGLGLASSENGTSDVGDALLTGFGVYVGGFVTLAGGVMTIVGGSLWGVGVNKRKEIENQQMPIGMPEIAVGPGSLSLSWRL